MSTTEKKTKSELRQEKYATAVTPMELITFITKAYEAGWRKSIVVLGEIGAGKSDSMREVGKRIAKQKGLQFWEYSQLEPMPENPFIFVDVRLTDLEPADLTGVPRDHPTDKNVAIFKVQEFAKKLAEHEGILFLDELTNESRPNMKAASYRILRDRMIGFIKLHKDVLVLGAGNYPDDAVGIAEPFPAPMVNRVCVVEMKTSTLKEWIDFMHHNVVQEVPLFDDKGRPIIDPATNKPKVEKKPAWDTRVAAFLTSSESMFIQKPKEAAMLENFPTPRAWTDLAKISHKLDINELKKAAEGSVGKQAAMHFIQFISTQIEPLEVYANDISKWTDLKMHSEEVAAKYLICCQLADKWADNTSLDNLGMHILSKDQDYMGMIFSMLTQKNKNAVVQRFIKKDKTILKFVKDMTFWNYNTRDADDSAIYK